METKKVKEVDKCFYQFEAGVITKQLDDYSIIGFSSSGANHLSSVPLNKDIFPYNKKTKRISKVFEKCRNEIFSNRKFRLKYIKIHNRLVDEWKNACEEEDEEVINNIITHIIEYKEKLLEPNKRFNI